MPLNRRSRLTPAQVRALGAIDGLLVDHDALRSVVVAILDFHAMRIRSGHPGFVALVGDTGSGKTTAIDLVERACPPAAESRQLRIARFTTPVNCTRKALVSNMLAALGDADPSRGTQENMMGRLKTLVAGRGVEMIIADEVQHLVSRTNNLVNYDMADLLKVLMDELRVPFVLVGLAQLDTVIEVNGQLHRRMYARLDALPFDLSSTSGFQQAAEFAAHYDHVLPFPEYCGLAERHLLTALLHVSKGYVGKFCPLIKLAATHAVYEQARRIEIEHLSRAWEQLERGRSHRQSNPFVGLGPTQARPKPVDD
jgi:hypothetical protein